MRLVLFETAAARSAVCMTSVLHVLQEPAIWPLPCVRSGFAGVILYQEQIVPLLSGPVDSDSVDSGADDPQGRFVLVCEAPFGLVGIPAERIERITSVGEIDNHEVSGQGCPVETIKINGLDYCLYNLNHLLETAAA